MPFTTTLAKASARGYGFGIGAVSNAWDIGFAEYQGVIFGGFNVVPEETSGLNLFFKPDGTKMYQCGLSGDDINEYSLSLPWNLATGTYVQSKSVVAQTGSPSGLFFKPDGTKCYVSSADTYEYDLPTPWDISTLSYVQTFASSAQTTGNAIFFKPDGTKMYLLGQTNAAVYEYSLSSAWDISSATYVQSFSISAQETAASGLSFKDDGTKMYIVGTSGDDINEYDLSSAWDISTASYLQNYAMTLFPSNALSNPTGLYFKPDGTRIFCSNISNDRIYSWSFSTPWDVSTGAQDIPTSNYFSPYSQDTSTQGVYISPDGLNMYVVGAGNDKVYQYSLASAWNISGATYVRDFSVATEETAPTDVFFKSDGTKMYVLGDTGNDVNEYALSVAWDISTATYTTVFSVAGQDTSPQGMYFKSDGSKMYVVGAVNDKVYEYSLSIAWDISSASYVRDFLVSTQELAPTGISFKSDGTQMYVIGSISDNLNQYALSTPWDISTASYQKAFYVGRMMVAATGLFFKDDGTEFYIIGSSNDGYILSYDIV